MVCGELFARMFGKSRDYDYFCLCFPILIDGIKTDGIDNNKNLT